MPAPSGGRGRSRKIGLALAGGGPGGAVYEIGALRALEEVLEGVELTELDVYVGVSAGAVIAAFLANGVTPRQMARAIVEHEPGEQAILPEAFFTPSYKEWGRRAVSLPRLLADALVRLAKRPGDQSWLRSLSRLAGALPVGVFDNEPIRRFLAQSFSRKGRTDDFRRLRRPLVVVASDLEAGRPIRFGEPGWDHVPISRAVQASTALPGLYPPVPIDGQLCVDGALLKTLHASVALDHGAGLVLCVNPIVPLDFAAGARRGVLRRGVLLDHGLPAVLSQTFRTLIHSRLEVGMAAYGKRYPEADVLLFEPESDEYGMFFNSIWSFAAREAVCEVGYDATRRELRRRRRDLEPRLARHGVRLRADVLDDLDRDLWSGLDLSEAAGLKVTRALDRTLSALEDSLAAPRRRRA
jgi:predicted acylesterase/phospholipase RssA